MRPLPISTAALAMSLAALFTPAGIASAQTPWTVTIVSSTTPLGTGNCSPIRLEVLDAAGGTVPRTPAGVRVGIADFDWSVAPAGKVVGRYDGASAWSACACPGSAGSVATITATYPAQVLNESARVPGVAFSSSITVPVVAANSSGVPFGCEKFKTMTVPTGDGKMPWTVILTSLALPIPIGTCSSFQVDLRDATGKEAPRTAAGRRVSLADFDWSAATGGKVVGTYNGPSAWSACACQGASVGEAATINASYPARALVDPVAGVAFQSSVTVPVSAANGTFNPPACSASTGSGIAVQPALLPKAIAIPVTAPTGVTIQATPTMVSIAWQPVRGAVNYTVERGTSSAGPWVALPWNSALGTQLTAPSPLAPASAGGQGALFYYRISAVSASGAPGVTIVPWITPSMESPMVAGWRQDHADLVIFWTPSPGAAKYIVTATGGAGGNRLVEVDTNATTLRIPGLMSAGGGGVWATVAVSVAARFDPGAISTPAAGTTIALAPVNSCWVQASTPGPAPQLTGQGVGVTNIRIGAAGPENSGAAVLIERALAGSSTWEPLGCNTDGARMNDVNLQPGTQYSYRLTAVSSARGVGQSIVTKSTEVAPATPTLSAVRSGASSVQLSWPGVSFESGTGSADVWYRITSSYGYSMLVPPSNSSSQSLNALNVPPGTHVFSLTVLYSLMRPSGKPPSQVTVIVPVPTAN